MGLPGRMGPSRRVGSRREGRGLITVFIPPREPLPPPAREYSVRYVRRAAPPSGRTGSYPLNVVTCRRSPEFTHRPANVGGSRSPRRRGSSFPALRASPSESLESGPAQVGGGGEASIE